MTNEIEKNLDDLRKEGLGMGGKEYLERLMRCFQVDKPTMLQRIEAMIADEINYSVVAHLKDMRFYVKAEMLNEFGLFYIDVLLNEWERINKKYRG